MCIADYGLCNHMLSAHVGYQQLDSMLRPLSIKPKTCKAREVGSNSYQCVEKGGKKGGEHVEEF